jgi:predicted DsbA family dithiol-disulfide isomerase
MLIEIWGDVVCPWCYVATARFHKALAAFEHHEEVQVRHRSFELEPGRDPAHIEPVPAFLTRRFGAQGPAMDKQVATLARAEKLPYRTDRLVGSTLDAHRLLHLAEDRGRAQQLLKVLFEANFGRAASIFTAPALLELAAGVGLERDAVQAVLEDPDAYLADVRADESAAADLGAHGVPFFLFDRRRALSGAQPAEGLAEALRSTWKTRTIPVLEAEGAVCAPDGSCAVPQP